MPVNLARKGRWLLLVLAILLTAGAASWMVVQSLLVDHPGPNPPITARTPWGQTVAPSAFTLADIATWNALKPGQAWSEGKAAGGAAWRALGKGEIAISRSPWTVMDGVWVIGPWNSEQNIYLIDTGQGLALIDPSLDTYQDEVLAQIAGLGFRPEQVKWVVLTHCHIDHAQSCQQWKMRGAKVIIGAGDAPELAACSDVVAKGFDPRANNRCTPCVADQRVVDGDVLQLGNLALHAIANPGHTPGSTSFAFQRGGKWLLLSGDIALHNGRHAWMGGTKADWGLYLISLGKLARWSFAGKPVRFDLLMPGHGTVDLDQGQRSVEQTERVVQQIVTRRAAGEKVGWIEAYPWAWRNRTSSPAPPATPPAT